MNIFELTLLVLILTDGMAADSKQLKTKAQNVFFFQISVLLVSLSVYRLESIYRHDLDCRNYRNKLNTNPKIILNNSNLLKTKEKN